MASKLQETGMDDSLSVLIATVIASMAVVAKAKQTLGQVRSTDKSDGTIFTKADLESTRVGCAILRNLNIPIWTEEMKRPKLMAGMRTLLFDPLDGTRYFMAGAPGVTVILGVIDASGRAEMAVVGEVDTGRIFFARKGFGAWWFYSRGNLEDDLKHAKRCQVWKGQVKTGTVYVDFTPGFTKEGYPPIIDSSIGRLFVSIFGSYRPNIGPNGINLALTAFGREGVVGQMTTALGGPWDVIGLLLVIEAGGYARGFKNGEPADPLLVAEYNVLITASTSQFLDDLSAHMLQSLYPK